MVTIRLIFRGLLLAYVTCTRLGLMSTSDLQVHILAEHSVTDAAEYPDSSWPSDTKDAQRGHGTCQVISKVCQYFFSLSWMPIYARRNARCRFYDAGDGFIRINAPLAHSGKKAELSRSLSRWVGTLPLPTQTLYFTINTALGTHPASFNV